MICSKKTILALLSVMFSISHFFAQALGVGDIMFIGFNTDGDDDFAIVVMRDITNECIYFSDQEVIEIGTTAEGVLKWDTGPVTISAGCVVVFSDVEEGDAQTASIGTLTEPNNAFNLSGTGDGILAYTGTDENTPTTFLAGIANQVGAFGDLSTTGLDGCSALTITNGVHDDGAAYTGPRNTAVSLSDYADSLKNLSNWTTVSGNGEAILPFNTTKFTVTGPMCAEPMITGGTTTICPGDMVNLGTFITGTPLGEL